MPVTRFIETSGSRAATVQRKGKRASSTVSLEFMAFGTSSDAEVHAYANTFFTNNRFYEIGTYRFMVESYSVEYLGDEAFRVTANYTREGQNVANDGTTNPLRRARSFDTSGGTQHITQAYGERRYPATAPDQKNAIGVDDDRVAGVDVITPALQWTETYDVPSWYVTSSYIKTVADLTGTVNVSSFRTFSGGEVLFVGCNGSQQWDFEKGSGPWTLQYKFIASPNRGLPTGATAPTGSYLPPLSVGSIDNIFKKGHEYLWVRYEDNVGDSSLLKVPKHVYVNSVYRSTDFTLLGIGGAGPLDPAVVVGGTYDN